MSTEFEIAARWWADRLREKIAPWFSDLQGNRELCEADRDIVDGLAETVRRKSLDGVNIDQFEIILARLTERLCRRNGWDKAKTEPHWGSACRTLATDYGACSELNAAFQYSGGNINAQPFPIKTVMWINPGSVKVSWGYAATPVELFAERESK